jgi:hypothetical protein
MNRIFKYCLLVALMSLAFAAAVQAQTLRYMNLGDLEYQTRSDFVGERLNYPVLWRDQTNTLLPSATGLHGSTYGFMIGVNQTYQVGATTYNKRVTELIPVKWSDTKNMTKPKGYLRTFRIRPGSKVINGIDFTDATIALDPSDPATPSDVMIYTKFETDQNIDVERWAYGFYNDKYNDFVITEWRLTNKGAADLKDVYFSVQTGVGSDQYGTATATFWGNVYGANYAAFAAGNKSADSLRVYYAFDGDVKSSKDDDQGKPELTYGYFRKAMYIAHAVVHADKSTTDETDDPAKPMKAGHSMRQWCPELSLSNSEAAYAYLSGKWDNTIPGLYTFNNDGFFRMLPPTWKEADNDPTSEPEKTSMQSFGPYQMKAGEDFRVVTAYAVGSINFKTAIAAGWAYDPTNLKSLLPRKPMPFAYGNFIKKGDLLTKAQKNQLIGTGLDSVMKSVSIANRLWKSSTVKAGKGAFSCEMAPPSPSLTAISSGLKTSLAWGDEAEKAGTIKGYRLYRNYKRPPTLKDPCDTSFVLYKEFPSGTRTFDDVSVVLGDSYYYTVTAVSQTGVESNAIYTRMGGVKTGTDRLRESITSKRSPDTQGWKDHVVVVPNPYHVRAVNKYEVTKLNFFNLPAYCNIHVYTVSGDKVQTLSHMSNSGEQNWDRQETLDTTTIVSGIYLFVVEELDASGNATGESTTGKFIVVK